MWKSLEYIHFTAEKHSYQIIHWLKGSNEQAFPVLSVMTFPIVPPTLPQS